jgi:hypothetical protein
MLSIIGSDDELAGCVMRPPYFDTFSDIGFDLVARMLNRIVKIEIASDYYFGGY